MIQWIKDNKTFVVLVIIAILLAIIVALMLSGNKVPTIIQTTEGNVGIGIPDNSTGPVVTMPPEMKPKPYVSPTLQPTSVMTPWVGG
jgi:hypothetical protein